MKALLSRTLLCIALAALPLGVAQAHGPWRAGAHNAYGWQLMTPKERIEHQRRLRGFTRYEACEAFEEAHRARLAARARAAGVAPPPAVESACRQLRARRELR